MQLPVLRPRRLLTPPGDRHRDGPGRRRRDRSRQFRLGVGDASAGRARPAHPGQRGGQPVRVELALGRPRVPDRARSEGLRRGAGGTAAGLAVAHRDRHHHRAAPVVGGLPAGRLQPHQPDGQRAAVQVHGADLPGGRREGHRGRGDQPHDRAGLGVLRRGALHQVRLPRPVRAEQFPRPERAVPDAPTATSTTSTTTPRCSSASWSRCPTCAPRPRTCSRRWPRT